MINAFVSSWLIAFGRARLPVSLPVPLVRTLGTHAFTSVGTLFHTREDTCLFRVSVISFLKN